MAPHGDTPANSLSPDCSSSYNPPLVIISEQGRHSVASRRIVRAQAARASAAQSRVTRARNREEREGTVQEGHRTPPLAKRASLLAQNNDYSIAKGSRDVGEIISQKPFFGWLVTLLNLSIPAIHEANHAFAIGAWSTQDPDTLGPVSSFRGANAVTLPTPSPGRTETTGLKLPMALPRGFVGLQHRLSLPPMITLLLSRTSCVDFESPGAETRLHQLLFDLLVSAAGPALFTDPFRSQGLQNHLCIACACLTIFQGQRVNGQIFAYDAAYQSGLKAAWAEALMLDTNALMEPKAADASIWIIFILSVTTASKAESYQQALRTLLSDLQLSQWDQVRKTLLTFIYPVSLLDELCKKFYHDLLK